MFGWFKKKKHIVAYIKEVGTCNLNAFLLKVDIYAKDSSAVRIARDIFDIAITNFDLQNMSKIIDIKLSANPLLNCDKVADLDIVQFNFSNILKDKNMWLCSMERCVANMEEFMQLVRELKIHGVTEIHVEGKYSDVIQEKNK